VQQIQIYTAPFPIDVGVFDQESEDLIWPKTLSTMQDDFFYSLHNLPSAFAADLLNQGFV